MNYRAETLAAFLRTVSRFKFDMDTWKDERTVFGIPCGTTACAGGWACSIAEFQRAGLIMDTERSIASIAYPVYGELRGFAALAAFFEISDQLARRWFCPSNYMQTATPKMVAERIESDVAWHRNTKADKELDAARAVTADAIQKASQTA